MKLFRIGLILLAFMMLSVLLTTSCSEELDEDVYLPDDIWVVGGNTYYKFSEALAAVTAGTSKAIDSSNTIKLVRDVGENERGEAIIIPETFTGEVEVNMNGKEYWFEDDLDYFFEVRGGKAVNFVGGTTVISENANLIPKALIIDANTVTLKNQKMDDRRPLPHEAIMITSKGILEIEGESSVIGDITVSGGGKLGVSGGTISSTTVTVEGSSEGSGVSKIDISGGTIDMGSLSVKSDSSDTDKVAAVNVTGGTVNVTTLDVQENSTVTVKESSSSVPTTVNIGALSAEGTGSSSKAIVEVSSGTVNVTGTLAAKKNSEVNIIRDTTSSEEKSAVVSIAAITTEGTVDSSNASAKVSISDGTVTITDFTTKDDSTVTIVPETSGTITLAIDNTQTDDSSLVTVDGGNVDFVKSVKTNTTENTGLINIYAGTIRTTEDDMEAVKDSRTEGSTATVSEYHKASTHHEYVEPTCTSAGCQEYWECAYCDYLFTSEDCSEEDKVESVDSLSIEALGHNPDSLWTYDDTGHWHECGNGCGEKLDYEEHTAGEAWKTTDTDGHYHVCSVCGGGQLGMEEHSFGEWTDTGVFRTRTCATCQRIEVSGHEHTMEAYEAVEATCLEDGQLAYWYCEGCGKYFLDSEGSEETTLEDTVVPATGHSTKHYQKQAATCTKDGSIEYWYCSGCDKYFSDSTYDTEVDDDELVIEATGHSFSEEWTYDSRDHWHVCSNGCSVVDGSEIHQYGDWSFDIEANQRSRTCTECGYVQIEDHDEHTLTKTEAVEETCTTDGNVDYWTCSVCGGIFLDEDATVQTTAAGTVVSAHHTLDTNVEAVDATCTEDGNVEYWICSACGKYFLDEDAEEETTLDETVLEALGHAEELTYKAYADATCTEDGNLEYWYCSQCGKYFSDEDCTEELDDVVLEATGHTYPDSYDMDASYHWKTCTVCGAETTHEAHTEETTTYAAEGTELSVTWGCKVCGDEYGTPSTVSSPSTGAFELIETYNGIEAEKQSDGSWLLTLDEDILDALGAVADSTKWIGGNNTTVISGESSITVTVKEGISRGVVFAHYYDEDSSLVGGGYAILPGNAASDD